MGPRPRPASGFSWLTGLPPLALEKCLQSGLTQSNPTGFPFNDPAAGAHLPNPSDLPLLHNPNAEQLAAVTLPQGNALILAGATTATSSTRPPSESATTRSAWATTSAPNRARAS